MTIARSVCSRTRSSSPRSSTKSRTCRPPRSTAAHLPGAAASATRTSRRTNHSYHLDVLRAAFVLSFLLVGCSVDATAASGAAVSEDVQAALSLAMDGVDSKPESLLEAYRLVEKHPPADTLPLLVDALETHPSAAVHLLGMLSWDHPERAFGPLRRLLVDKGPPFNEDRGGEGLLHFF